MAVEHIITELPILAGARNVPNATIEATYGVDVVFATASSVIITDIDEAVGTGFAIDTVAVPVDIRAATTPMHIVPAVIVPYGVAHVTTLDFANFTAVMSALCHMYFTDLSCRIPAFMDADSQLLAVRELQRVIVRSPFARIPVWLRLSANFLTDFPGARSSTVVAS